MRSGDIHGGWSAVGFKRLTMKKFTLLCLFFCGAAQALTITDDRGVTVTFAQTPQRIVSMLPSLTESVCAMEQCQRLVGVDRYSNYPDSLKKLPKALKTSCGFGINSPVEYQTANKSTI